MYGHVLRRVFRVHSLTRPSSSSSAAAAASAHVVGAVNDNDQHDLTASRLAEHHWRLSPTAAAKRFHFRAYPDAAHFVARLAAAVVSEEYCPIITLSNTHVHVRVQLHTKVLPAGFPPLAVRTALRAEALYHNPDLPTDAPTPPPARVGRPCAICGGPHAIRVCPDRLTAPPPGPCPACGGAHWRINCPTSKKSRKPLVLPVP